jgi:hypothetical protein
MPSIVNATTTAGVAVSGDNSGVLALQTNNGTTAVTIDTSQNVGIGTSSVGVFGVSSGRLLNVVSTTNYAYLQLQGSAGNGGAIDFGDATVRAAEIASLSGSALAFYLNPTNSGNSLTERMRITSTGNVGIGTTSPSATLDVGSSVARSGAAQNNIYADYRITGATTGIAGSLASRIVGIGGSTYTIPDVAVYKADPTVAQTGVTITNSYGLYIGNMADPTSGGTVTNAWGVYQTASSNKNYFAGQSLFGATSLLGSRNSQVGININGKDDALFIQNYGSGIGWGITMRPSSSSSGGNGDCFNFTNTSFTTVGTIATSSSATAYNTTSDYRLKENVAPMTGALATVAQLKPVTYKWKADGKDGQGFIAHELQSVVPEAVTGEKDAIDKDGNPRYQGVDASFLVATLTAAIQELNVKVEAQAAEIAALKGVA